MVLELFEDAFGDYRNALALAKAAELAYLPEDLSKAEFAAQLGLNARLISVDNIQAYLALNADHIVVAFRGQNHPSRSKV